MPKNGWKVRGEFGKVSMALGGGERKVQGSRLGVAYKSGLWGYPSVALWKVTTIETDGTQVEKKRVTRFWDCQPNVGGSLDGKEFWGCR